MEVKQYKKGLWTVEEDKILMDYITIHGEGHWSRVAMKTGLKRGGKSCRLRWMNYLCPKVKRGDFSEEEEDLIIRLHNLLGNRWSLIAGRVPGRTDNQVKNYWNTHLSKKLGIRKTKKKPVINYCNLEQTKLAQEGVEPEKSRVPVPEEIGNSGGDGGMGTQVKESLLKGPDPHQLLENESFLNSWFCSENLRPYSPCLMEFQYGSVVGSFDEVWFDSNCWF